MKSTDSFITGLLTGAVLGGVIALLYAPKSGKETRDHLREKFSEVEKEFDSLKEKASEKSARIKEDLARRLAELKEEIDNLSKAM
jgi:gas vesicle protein